MKLLSTLCATLVLAACQNHDGVAIIVDQSYRPEIVATSREGFSAPDGLLWWDGALYMADEGGSAVRCWTPGAAPRTLAHGQGIASPEDLARGRNGEIYFSDDDSGGIWRIGRDGRLSHLVLGLRSTEAIIVAPSGDLLVGDQVGRRILRVSPDGRTSELIGAQAGIAKPESMALDPAGNLYIADNAEDVLYLRTKDGVLHKPIHARRGFSPETLHHAGGVLYISDSKNGAVYRYTPEDGLATIATFAGDLGNVQGLTSDDAGNLYVSVQTDLQRGRGYILRLRRGRQKQVPAGAGCAA